MTSDDLKVGVHIWYVKHAGCIVDGKVIAVKNSKYTEKRFVIETTDGFESLVFQEDSCFATPHEAKLSAANSLQRQASQCLQNAANLFKLATEEQQKGGESVK